MRRFGFEGVVLVVWKGETPPPPGGGFPLEERLLGMGREGGRILDWEVLV